VSKDDAKLALLRELLRRQRCRTSLHTFALSVDIPTAPMTAMRPDEELLGPAYGLMTIHHAKILETLERTMNRPFGRAVIMAPPGSAKSLYGPVVASAWEMGRKPGSRIILTSYASKIAERQARRTQQICMQPQYRDMWPHQPLIGRDAAGDWELGDPKNPVGNSNMLAMGLTAGLTGNRASGAFIDDPVAGREQADSEAERQNTLDSYQDDLLTRLLPGAWLVLILTRWHEQDLAGSILPEDYKGQSGMIKCRDGLDWEVLNIPAKAEQPDDPLGRKPGEYMWPEWFPEQHWHMFEQAQGREAARVWASLYQQRPAPQGDGRFTEGSIDYYKEGSAPPFLAYVGAGDYAVTEGKNDFTELGVFGVDPEGGLWEMDWWHKQSDTGESTEKTLDMVKRWKIPMWFNEGGVIDKAVGPLMNLRMRQRKIFTDRRALPSMQDKVAKCASFQARCGASMVHFRDNANSRRVVAQLLSLGAGRYDDAADVCGLIGRAVDQFPMARVPSVQKREGIKPFTSAWLEYGSGQDDKKTRYR
jgi:hypothetical protein